MLFRKQHEAPLAILALSIVALFVALQLWRARAPEHTPAYHVAHIEPVTPSDYLLLGTPIDINTAGAEHFQALDRVGPKLARRIVKNREVQGAFTSVDDLIRVKGIGPKLLERMRPYVTAR